MIVIYIRKSLHSFIKKYQGVADINISAIYDLQPINFRLMSVKIASVINKPISFNDSAVIDPGYALIFRNLYKVLSIKRWKTFGAIFKPKCIHDHSNKPDGVMNAEITHARCVKLTTRNLLTIYK